MKAMPLQALKHLESTFEVTLQGLSTVQTSQVQIKSFIHDQALTCAEKRERERTADE